MSRASIRKHFKNGSILVTGGAGFIGSHLVDEIIDDTTSKVVVIDNLFCGSLQNLAKHSKKRLIIYKDDAKDINILTHIIKKHKIKTIFNCATKALNYSFINPKEAFDVNVQIIENLLELQRRKSFNTLCHFSTSEVYGTAQYEPMDENHPLCPTTTYAAGKAAADLLVQSYVRMFGVDAFIVRPFNNFGPRQNSEGDLAGVIPRTVDRILNHLAPEIHGSGEQVRDFIFVKDTVKIVCELFTEIERGGIVNIASSNKVSVNHLITLISKKMNCQLSPIRKRARNADVRCHVGSNKKLSRLTKYKLLSFDKALDEAISFYREQFSL